MLFFFACGELLGLREVEDPDVNIGSTWIPATQGEILFSNLESVFEGRNKEYYLYNFYENDSSAQNTSFKFIASPTAQIKYSDKFIDWTLQNEYSWFSGLLSQVAADSVLSLEFTTIQLVTDYGDSLKYYTEYLIKANHSQTSISRIFSGNSYFILIRDPLNYWRILNWEDFNSSGDPDWSVLKAQF